MVEVAVGDSSHPRGPLSSASRTTASVWPAAAEAARLLHSEIVRAAQRRGFAGSVPTPGGILHAGELVPFESLLPRLPAVQVTSGRPPDRHHLRLPIPFAHLSFGRGLSEAAHMVEVEVDTSLGRVRPRRVWVGLATGRIHSPQMATSQVHGGVIQGLGYALYEERHVDPHLGLVLTADLESYRLPGIADTPEIEVTFIEEGFEHVAGGGIGMAEVATLGMAAAVANAVAHATGRRLRHLPLRPDRVLAALHRTP
jgi:xanthine dehydrogenase YagR molybdenum-binding subunit